MKRIRILGLCLIAVFAMSAVAAGSASTANAVVSTAPEIKGKPGLIVFVGSGPIDQGPSRPGVATAQGVAKAGAEVEPPAEFARRVPPTQRRVKGQEALALSSGSGHPPTTGLPVGQAGSELLQSFDGLTARDQLFARRFQFDGEPPDQGLCVGNGYVLESVNSALRVYDTRGAPLTAPIALTQFYGYPPHFDPETRRFGSISSDISCLYDSDTHRWFHLAWTLDLDPQTGAVTGRNRLDLAVSQGPSPLGLWNYYAIPTQNDGSEGTPDHNCYLGPCFSDFPHMGADRNGIYITTNEFGDIFGPSDVHVAFSGVNLWAISKGQLVRGVSSPTIRQWFRFEYPFGGLAFRVWPAISANSADEGGANGTSANSADEGGANGTQYLVSNVECFEAVCTDNRLVVWAVKNTASLEASRPDPRLTSAVVDVTQYSNTETLAEQPPGDIPLAECINDTSTKTPFGVGCWRYFLPPEFEPAHNEIESMLDSGFGSFQVYFAGGRLWTAQPTPLVINGKEKAGIAWYIIRPTPKKVGIEATLERDGQFGVANNHVILPTVAVTRDLTGIISFTLVGEDHYPSAAYVRLDQSGVERRVRLVAPGVGPVDGVTGYAAFGPPFQRFGDYGAAVADGNTIWAATEYIGQTCTLKQYLRNTKNSPLFSCRATRTAFANWYTRIWQVQAGQQGGGD
jgi:hypothetical protein